jgi:hypothetical protein
MSTTTQVRRTGPGRGGERPVGSSEGPPSPLQAAPVAAAATARRYRVMFVVPFQTAMSDADTHRLNSVLGMDTHLHPKLRASPASPGVSRLDFFSGLFLVRGDGPQDWRLEGRTWGGPAPQSVHGWHLVAADAARLLDPTVPVPSRLESTGLLTTTGGRTGRRSRRRSRRWQRP